MREEEGREEEGREEEGWEEEGWELSKAGVDRLVDEGVVEE